MNTNKLYSQPVTFLKASDQYFSLNFHFKYAIHGSKMRDYDPSPLNVMEPFRTRPTVSSKLDKGLGMHQGQDRQ